MPTTNLGASNLVVPGAYVNVQNPQQGVAPYVNTTVNAFVGTANYGPVGVPVVIGSAAQIFAAFGDDTIGASTFNSTNYNFSLVQEMLMSLVEDGNMIGVRATNGADTAATIVLPDAVPATVLTLTFQSTGSLPNGPGAGTAAPGDNVAGARIDLVSGTSSVSPVLRVTIFPPRNARPEVFNNIIGYSSPGGAYSATVFKANALAAINGTAPNSIASQWVVASAGSSSAIPVLATVASASGGADGSSTVSPAELLGSADTLTGMNALAGTPFFQLVICGLDDNFVSVPTISSFVAAQNAALGFTTVPKGTTDAAAFTDRLTVGAVDTNMVCCKDFIYVFDTVQGYNRYVSPMGKAAGIIGGLPAYQSPINQPYNTTGASASSVEGTEQSILGPRSQDALAALTTNGICSITNQMPLNNGAFGFFNDVTMAGSGNPNNYIPVIRMTAFLSQALQQIGGPFVGQNQSIQPNDPTRAAIKAAFDNFLDGLIPNGGQPQIDEFNTTCDLTNNTPSSIAQGICNVQVLVRYLGVIRILYITLQGGTGVTVSQTPPQL
jgi:hypothetical protein